MVILIKSFLVLAFSQACIECDFLKTGWAYQNDLMYDSAIYNYSLAIEYAKQNDNPTYLGYAEINLANVYGKLGLFDSAIHHNQRAIESFSEIQNYEQVLYAHVNIAECYNDVGHYRLSLLEVEKARKIVKRVNDLTFEYLLNTTAGRAWLELEEIELSKAAYKTAYAMANHLADTLRKHKTLVDLGNLFFENQEFDSASVYFHAVIASKSTSTDSATYAMAMNNLGEILLVNNAYRQAYLALKEALAIKKKFDPAKLGTTYANLARALMGENHQLAKSYLDSALNFQDFEVQIEANKGLVAYYQQTEQFPEALATMRLLDSLKNEQFNNERLEASKLQASIDLSNVNSQLDQQVIVNENQRKMNWYLFGFGLAVFIAAMVLFILFRTNLKLRRYNELLLKEQNHRVKNNLQMINSLLSLQSQKLPSIDAKVALNESKSRINSVALLHRMLYEGTELGVINTKQYLINLIEELGYTSSRKINWNIEIDPEIQVSVEKATSLGLIVNELITNSIKHVSPEIELTIQFEMGQSAKEVELKYGDNGGAFDPEVWKTSESFGNQLIRIQSEQLRGSYKVHSNNGFYYSLKLSA